MEYSTSAARLCRLRECLPGCPRLAAMESVEDLLLLFGVYIFCLSEYFHFFISEKDKIWYILLSGKFRFVEQAQSIVIEPVFLDVL